MKINKPEKTQDKKTTFKHDKIHLLSEKSLAKDWLKKPENKAWKKL
jgi:hypothetical protein